MQGLCSFYVLNCGKACTWFIGIRYVLASKEVVDTALLLKYIVFHLFYVTLSHLQAPVNIAGGVVNGSVLNYTFTYDDGSGSPTFVLPSANCSGDVCEHIFNIPTSNVPPSYNVSVTATNVFGEGPANTSQPICEQMDNRVITSQVGSSIAGKKN